MSQIAVIYARFSSAGQAEGSSLERQLSNGRKYVEKQGWTLGEELSDLARSAFHGANRMSALLEALSAGLLDHPAWPRWL